MVDPRAQRRPRRRRPPPGRASSSRFVPCSTRTMPSAAERQALARVHGAGRRSSRCRRRRRARPTARSAAAPRCSCVSATASKSCSWVATSETSNREVSDSPPRRLSAPAGSRRAEPSRRSAVVAGSRTAGRSRAVEVVADPLGSYGRSVDRCRRRPAPASPAAATVSPVVSRSQPSSVHSTCWIAVSRPSIDRRAGSERARAEVGDVPLAVRRVDQGAVSGLLQLGVRVVQVRAQVVVVVAAEVRRRVAGEERVDRSRLVRAGDRRATGRG